MNTTTTLTRRELYELVWQTPMKQLGEKYGVPGSEIAKLCDRNAVPRPAPGHWPAVRRGFVMKPDVLPPDPPESTRIEIASPSDAAREEHPVVAAQIEYEKTHSIVVAEKMSRPHPLVTQTRTESGTWLPITVSAKQLPRALRFFDALFKACEARRFSVKHTREDYKSRTTIEAHGEEMAIALRESNKQSDHVLTADEEASKKKYGHSWARRYDFTPTGRFAFTIDEWAGGMQHRWTDRDRRPLEACLNEIMVALVRISVTVLTPRRIEWDLQRKIREEQERVWQVQREKLDKLNRALPEWRQAQGLREFIEAVETEARAALGPATKDGPIGEWLAWARAVADRSDPVKKFVRELSDAAARDAV